MKTRPYTMLLMMLAGWINRQQQEAINYLMEENKILKHELLKATGKKRIILNDTQRRRLAILAKRVGRKMLFKTLCCFLCVSMPTYVIQSSTADSFRLYAALLPQGNNLRLPVATCHHVASTCLSGQDDFCNRGVGRSIFSMKVMSLPLTGKAGKIKDIDPVIRWSG